MDNDKYSRETYEALTDVEFGPRNSTLFNAFKRAAIAMTNIYDMQPFLRGYQIGSSFIMAVGDPRVEEWDKHKEEMKAAITTAVKKKIDDKGSALGTDKRTDLAEAALQAVLTFKPSTAALV